MLRLLKVCLVAFVGLQGLIYFGANLANWEAARGAVEITLAMAERPYYPNALAPAIKAPFLVTLVFLVILAGELLVGFLSFKGAFDMFGALKKSPESFNAAKRYALIGGGMALLVWFGLFTVIGGALFQMWQTELGRLSLADAHIYLVPSALAVLFVALRDD